MQIFKIKKFSQWAKNQMLSDELLNKSAREIEKGLVEANLGGNLYKKRISLKGRGKRGGGRTLVIFKKGYRTFFVYGFSKNERSNISKNEEKLLKLYGKTLLGFSDVKINEAIKNGELIKIKEVN